MRKVCIQQNAAGPFVMMLPHGMVLWFVGVRPVIPVVGVTNIGGAVGVPTVDGLRLGIPIVIPIVAIEGPGNGTPTSPLSPAPLRSVAPIGMFAPPTEVAAEDVTAPDPGTDDSPDDTGKPSAIVPQPTVSPVLMSGEVVPPSSNMLLGPTGLELNGTTADPVRTGHSDGAGLNPPGKSSVAASGIPAPPTGDIKVPSDDVIPAPGVGGPPTTTI
jgi:hypothetical protein